MAVCAFFGHRDTMVSSALEDGLTEVVRELILKGVDTFWLCEQGTFDMMTRFVMKELRVRYPWIRLFLFVAYLPSEAKSDWMYEQDYDLMYPDELRKVPPQIAILKRNEYIAKNADYIVCYIIHKYGGAYQAVKKAEKYEKKIINLADVV